MHPVDPGVDATDVLDKPVRLVLVFGRGTVADYRFTSPVISIGREGHQDVVIDNSSVSREHCRIRREEGRFVVHDLGTPNGTTVNGRAAVLQALASGDEVGIGEFVILFNPSAEQLAKLEYRIEFPEEHAGGNGKRPETKFLGQEEIDHIRRSVNDDRAPHLRLIGNYGGGRPGRRFLLLENENLLGAAIDADVPLVGAGVRPQHAVLTRDGDRFAIRHVAGYRKVFVNGRPIKWAPLKNRDQIKIGRTTFQFYDSL